MARSSSSTQFTRREALGLLGAGAGFGVVAGMTEQAALAQTPGWVAARSGNVSFPRGAIIRTVLKDISPNEIRGATLMHEHLIGLGSWASPPPQCPMPCTPSVAGPVMQGVDLLVDELKASAADQLGCIVNSTISLPTEQNVKDLRDLATRSRVHIVAGGGYFRQGYPPNFMQMSDDAFTESLVKNAEAQRWGAFGECGTAKERMEPDERKYFTALAKAQVRTNLPIFTHNPHESCPSCALEQLELLTKNGVNPKSLCIGHMSTIKLEDDPQADTFKTVAKAGAFFGLDTVGHQMASSHIPERQKVRRVLQLLELGFEDHICLSSDFAQAFNLKANWGSGYSSVLIQFVPKLRHAGVKDAILHKILVDNPRRFLAFVPK